MLYEEKDPNEKERIKKLREKERAYEFILIFFLIVSSDDGWTETQYGNE